MPSSAIKEKSEHSRLLVFLYALAMVGFGVFFGIIYLMSFPLEAYSNLDERNAALEGRESLAPVPGDAYYIEGPTLRTRTWEEKRELLLDGSARTLRVTPGEINAWFEAKFRGGKSEAEEDVSGLTLEPDTPNLGINEEGTIYLNLPADITGYGLDGSYVLSARVRYADGAPPSLVVEHLQIGGAAVPFPRVLGAQFADKIIKAFQIAEEYAVFREAWGRIESLETEKGALVLTLKRP